ncbi:MAG: permease prefix domain 1-containing protein [Clostridiales Family XIII bacterium]|jgi:hypothetical protein|nr:permease prefix domain 1-containing protein [Clostridiales Family XIII bacterium]
MNTRQQIEALFSGYEKSTELADFMEELESNLNDRVAFLKQKGLGGQEALDKALAELGDVSALADELSLKRKQEVISEMYMKTRNYISPPRMALYVALGALIGFGAIVGGVIAFGPAQGYDIAPAILGTLMIFCGGGILGLIFLGLTQETASKMAMPWKRALWYLLAAALVIFGLSVTAMVYVNYIYFDLAEAPYLSETLATLIPFFLPGAALGIFLILTEKDLSKPWVAKLRKEALESAHERFGSPVQQERFGLICGAIWIAAIAAFILLSITVGFKFSWLAFVAALVAQLLVQAAFSKDAAGGAKDGVARKQAQ